VSAALWVLFVGNLRRDELIVGALSVATTTCLIEFVRRAEKLAIEWRPGDLLQALWIPWYIVLGVGEVVIVLAKDVAGIERAKSLFLTAHFKASRSAHANEQRLLASLYTTATPNFIVLGINSGSKRMLYHQLKKTEIPRMAKHLGAGP
jgi:multisubunit Na+/H+ antiporter MnhE subunit